jgi:2,4-dienoyl-CoA reductase-like NADH-dependent reductase (Old Yellow Enzyme family)
MNSILFKPFSIKGLQVKNRFVRSATIEGVATVDGRPTKRLEELYFNLADGEIGLIVTSATLIDGETYRKAYRKGLSQVYRLMMDEDRYIEGWKELIDGVHERGAKIAVQLGHSGRQELPELRSGGPIAPSAVPLRNTGVIPRAMTVEEIKEMVEKFAQGCRRVMEAGFDAAQLHGGHGYLISSFLSPYANVRTDEYGGSVENRARFLIEIVKRTRELISDEYPLMIKMNFDDFVDGGLEKEEAVQIAKMIIDAGIDCIEVTGGTGSDSRLNIVVPAINTVEKEAYFAPYAEFLKKYVSVPVILVGGLRSPSVMEKLVQGGVAEFVSMCRPLIREPGLVKRWKQGDLKRAKCVSCNKCSVYHRTRPLRCYVDEPLKDGEA